MSRTVPAETSPAMPFSFAALLGVTIAYARPDRIVGEMKIAGRHLAPQGTIHMGAVLGFAEELSAHGAFLNRCDGMAAVTVEAKTNLFRPCRSPVLGGEAVPLHRDETLMVWQTSVYDSAGRIVAVTSQTQQLVADAATPARAEPVSDARIRAGGLPGSVAEVRREQIVAAACDVIARKGFANATIREIAEAAGLHVPTMYQYVGSKDELLELVYFWVMDRLRTDVDEATRGCATARDKLLATVAAMVVDGDHHRRHVGVLNRELKSLPPPARQRVLAAYRKLLDRIAAIIAEGIEGGEFRRVEPEIAANFVEALCDIWPLRPFAVGKFGLDAFQREIAAFIDSSLVQRSP